MRYAFLFSLTVMACVCFAQADTSAHREFRILSYNVKFLPSGALHLKHHPIARAKLIPQKLMDDSIDVVVLQEMFDAPSRRIMQRKLKHYFPYMIGPRKHKPKGFKRGTGVMIMSRYPMRPLEKIEYTNCKGVDCLGKKGVIIAEIDLPGQKIQIAGTHMQAGGGRPLKLTQHIDMGNLLNKYATPGIPQIVAGDFNTHHNDTIAYPHLLKQTKAENGPFSGEQQYTSDHALCDMYPFSSSKRGIVDYILYRGNGVEPQSASRCVRIYRQRWSKKHQDLSDHFAVLMRIRF